MNFLDNVYYCIKLEKQREICHYNVAEMAGVGLYQNSGVLADVQCWFLHSDFIFTVCVSPTCSVAVLWIGIGQVFSKCSGCSVETQQVQLLTLSPLHNCYCQTQSVSNSQ